MKRYLRAAVIFSLCQSRLTTDFNNVHEAIEFISGQPVWTHQIPRVFTFLQPTLRKQFPWAFSDDATVANDLIGRMADSNAPRESLLSEIDSQMRILSEKFGDSHEVTQIEDPESIYKNPLVEAAEMFGGRVVAESR